MFRLAWATISPLPLP